MLGNGEYMILWRIKRPQIYLPKRPLKDGQGNCAQDLARHKLYILLCAGFCFSLFLFSIKSIFFFLFLVRFKNLSNLNCQENGSIFRLNENLFQNIFKTGLKLQQKNRKMEIVWLFFF